ncbi:MAG: CBS domain-containing protein [Candidatus Saliniplasma sp.]
MEKVKDLMTEDPVVAELPGNRTDVIRIMVKNDLTGVPVVKDGKLKGFLSRHDIFDHPDEDQLAMIYEKDHPKIAADDPLKDAARKFVEEDVHYLPVTENGDICIGIITTADMLEYVEELKMDIPVGDTASSPCVPIYEGTPIKIALQTMKLTGIYAFPVVDKNTTVVGILTDRDLFNLSEISGELVVSELGLEQDEDSWSWQGLKNIMKLYYEESKFELPSIPVKEAMIEDPVSVFSGTEIFEAAKIMRRNDYGQLPVVDETDTLDTMVYELDLLSAII